MGSQVIWLPYFYKYWDWKSNSPRCYSVWYAIFYYIYNGYKENHTTNISFPIYLREQHSKKAEIQTKDNLIQRHQMHQVKLIPDKNLLTCLLTIKTVCGTVQFGLIFWLLMDS